MNDYKDPVFITGHQHPDTDSIASAIAYAFFKKARYGIKAIPCRLGAINNETAYLLQRFGFDEPCLIKDARKKISEIEIDPPEYITPEMSVLDTVRKMHETDRSCFAVLDSDHKILGFISKSDLVNIALGDTAEEIELLQQTSIYQIAESIDGTIIYDDLQSHINGKVSIIALSNTGTDNYEIRDRICIIGDDAEAQKELIRNGAGLLIAVWTKSIDESVLKAAAEYHCPIIRSGHGSMNTSRYIYLAPPVRLIMKKPVILRNTMLVDDAAKKMAQSRFRSYPVVDESNHLFGYIGRYHILNSSPKNIILVDHNEFQQSVHAIEKARILEVVDHHRINDFATTQPVSFRNEIVGSTATIITAIFRENQIPIPSKLAGLLLGAVLSDTLNFQSPTTTTKDREVANILAALAELDLEEFAKDMFTATAASRRQTIHSLIVQDIKYYEINGNHIMISQAIVSSLEKIRERTDEVEREMQRLVEKKNLHLLVCVFTSIIDNGSIFFFNGEKAAEGLEAFPDQPNEFHSLQPGILSRKSQILPAITSVLSD